MGRRNGGLYMENVNSAFVKRTQWMYIWQAALEHLISILVAGSYLATLTRELGFSDSLTGILSSIISLGSLFQLMTVTLRRRRVKGIVVTLSILNQLLFALLYVIPLSGIGQKAKIVVFVVFIVSAYMAYNFAHPKKINWLMSLVDDRQRGSFTANKEIVSLLAGMIFSFLMGAVTDYFSEIGQIRIAFMISAGVIFGLMVLHSFCLLGTSEQEMPETPKKSIFTDIGDIFRNKAVLKVTGVFVIYYIAKSISVPFYGTYLINELGCNLKFISALSIFSSIARILVSKFLGRYADKKSFADMIEKCFLIMALGHLCVICAVPANGKIMFALYYLFQGVAMGGVNSALVNLVFDYVPYEKRSNSLAVCQAASGTVGFFATLLVSPLVSRIQGNGNTFMGIHIYAQQLFTILSFTLLLLSALYVRLVLIRRKKDA